MSLSVNIKIEEWMWKKLNIIIFLIINFKFHFHNNMAFEKFLRFIISNVLWISKTHNRLMSEVET